MQAHLVDPKTGFISSTALSDLEKRLKVDKNLGFARTAYLKTMIELAKFIRNNTDQSKTALNPDARDKLNKLFDQFLSHINSKNSSENTASLENELKDFKADLTKRMAKIASKPEAPKMADQMAALGKEVAKRAKNTRASTSDDESTSSASTRTLSSDSDTKQTNTTGKSITGAVAEGVANKVGRARKKILHLAKNSLPDVNKVATDLTASARKNVLGTTAGVINKNKNHTKQKLALKDGTVPTAVKEFARFNDLGLRPITAEQERNGYNTVISSKGLQYADFKKLKECVMQQGGYDSKTAIKFVMDDFEKKLSLAGITKISEDNQWKVNAIVAKLYDYYEIDVNKQAPDRKG